MSYKLSKPYTQSDISDFIVEYNHKKGLKIVETDDYIYALEKNEIIYNNEPQINPEYSTQLANERELSFKRDFFETSLGWIRRKVNMKDGSIKDFLSDLLIPIKVGLENGYQVNIIVYRKPDFTQDFNILDLQEIKAATPIFVEECLLQTVNDFGI